MTRSESKEVEKDLKLIDLKITQSKSKGEYSMLNGRQISKQIFFVNLSALSGEKFGTQHEN